MSTPSVVQIEAIIRRDKVPEVDKALRSLGVSGVTMIEARGRGRDMVITTSYVRGKWTFSTDIIRRVIVNVVVGENDANRVVNAIVKSASTKSVGDGKIFVHPIERAVDISTGEADDHALNPGRAVQKSAKQG